MRSWSGLLAAPSRQSNVCSTTGRLKTTELYRVASIAFPFCTRLAYGAGEEKVNAKGQRI